AVPVSENIVAEDELAGRIRVERLLERLEGDAQLADLGEGLGASAVLVQGDDAADRQRHQDADDGDDDQQLDEREARARAASVHDAPRSARPPGGGPWNYLRPPRRAAAPLVLAVSADQSPDAALALLGTVPPPN